MHNTCIQLTRLTKEKCNNRLNVINWDLMNLAFNLELDDCDYQEVMSQSCLYHFLLCDLG